MSHIVAITSPATSLARLGHYSDAIMNAMASQITGVTITYSTLCSGADQRIHQSSVTRKKVSFDDFIMFLQRYTWALRKCDVQTVRYIYIYIYIWWVYQRITRLRNSNSLDLNTELRFINKVIFTSCHWLVTVLLTLKQQRRSKRI